MVNMTPRDRYRRAQGFARANKQAFDECVRLIRASSGFWNYRPDRQPRLALLRDHERHAYDRLPERARQQLQRP